MPASCWVVHAAAQGFVSLQKTWCYLIVAWLAGISQYSCSQVLGKTLNPITLEGKGSPLAHMLDMHGM